MKCDLLAVVILNRYQDSQYKIIPLYPKQAMRLISIHPHLDTKSLHQKMQEQRDVRLFQYWQIVYCIQSSPGKQAKEYAALLGVRVSKIYRIVQLYNNKGAGFTEGLQWGGRREQLSWLTLSEESELMAGLQSKAGKGEIITMTDIRSVVESKTAKPVSDDYLWDLFKRHGWKKKAPRPQHPQKNKAAQEAFKKNSPVCWIPADKG
jgi:transposase